MILLEFRGQFRKGGPEVDLHCGTASRLQTAKPSRMIPYQWVIESFVSFYTKRKSFGSGNYRFLRESGPNNPCKQSICRSQFRLDGNPRSNSI